MSCMASFASVHRHQLLQIDKLRLCALIGPEATPLFFTHEAKPKQACCHQQRGSQALTLCCCASVCSQCDAVYMQLIMEVMTQLEGAYALLIKSSHYPGELVACKRGSPLILGIKETPVHNLKRTSSSLISDLREIRKRPAGEAFEAFVASDASAVVEHTKRFAATLTPTLSRWQTLGHVSTCLVHAM